MQKKLLGALALSLVVSTLAIAGPAAKKPDYASIADKILGSVVTVKEGDIVSINGDVRDIDLASELALAAEKRGADALQTIGKESYGPRFFKDVPAKYDSKAPVLGIELAKFVDVTVSFDGQENPGLMMDIPADRIMARGKARMQVADAFRKAGIRQVNIGNGLYPTDATAKQYGLTKDQLSGLFWGGIDVDYVKLQAEAETARATLAAGKQVHVTHPNGTDLKFSIEARPVAVNDGVISAEDVKRGGPSLQVWLPAGEVYVTPVPGTAEGKIVWERLPFADSAIEGLTITMKGGKVVTHTAKASKAYDRWKEFYTAGSAGHDEFGVFDVGLNRAVKVPAGSKLVTWIPAGTVSLGFGENVWAGGTNESTGGFAGFTNGATVTVDGKAIVEKGELKLPSTGS